MGVADSQVGLSVCFSIANQGFNVRLSRCRRDDRFTVHERGGGGMRLDGGELEIGYGGEM